MCADKSKKLYAFKPLKWLFIGVILIIQTQISKSQTYEETVRYIFLSDKYKDSIILSSEFGMKSIIHLKDFNMNKCTVNWIMETSFSYNNYEEKDIDVLTFNLSGIGDYQIKQMCWRSHLDKLGKKICDEYKNYVSLENKSDLVRNYTSTYQYGHPIYRDCKKNCNLVTVDEIDKDKINKAFAHLWTNYCQRGKNEAF